MVFPMIFSIFNEKNLAQKRAQILLKVFADSPCVKRSLALAKRRQVKGANAAKETGGDMWRSSGNGTSEGYVNLIRTPNNHGLN